MLIGNYFRNINLKHKKHFFLGLSFNSLTCKKNDIFFAVKGTENDGNKFIEHAIKKGARTIVYNKKFEGIKNNVLYIKSKNVRKTLAEISFKLYNVQPRNIIAVTGTNGKSSIANFYFQILICLFYMVYCIQLQAACFLFGKIFYQKDFLDLELYKQYINLLLQLIL